MSEVKKNIDSLNLEKVSAILLDVAGTTTAINFVKDTLHPYVTKTIEEFLKNTWEDEAVKKAVSQFEEKDLDVTKATAIVKTLTEKDDSNIGLKTIQGLVFKKGYESGELKGHIFADVPKCLESWSKSKKVAIFSTGSVDSQQLLFRNTVEGDLSSHISKYFDQSVGIKSEAGSYKKIAEELGAIPENILFLTDDTKEAEAAKSANLIAVLVEREGNSPIPEELLSTFVVIKSFADIPLETIKRKIEEESSESGRKKQPPTKIAKTEEKETTNGDVEKIEEEVTEKDQNVEKESKTEETKAVQECEEAMEVDVEEKSISTEKAGKPEKVETTTTEEKAASDKKTNSEEKSTTDEKSAAQEKSVKEEKHVKQDESITEKKPVSDGKTETETKSVTDEKPATEKKTTTIKKPTTEEKTPTTEKHIPEDETTKEKTVTQEKEVVPITEDKPESMEVDTVESGTKETKNEDKLGKCVETKKIEESVVTKKDKVEEINEKPKVPENTKEGKTEIEIGTQTKTITNECETQTTISIKVAEELPVKEVQAKLMASEAENKKKDDGKSEVSAVDKIKNSDKTEKDDKLGDKIEEKKKKEVHNSEENKLDKVGETKKVEKESTTDTNIKEKELSEVECKLEKTNVDKAVNEEVVKETKEENESKEHKDSNKVTEVQKSSEIERNEVKEIKKSNEEIPKENGVREEKSAKDDEVVEEKENKSELANGTENCVSNGEAGNSSAGDVETKEDEIKVKTIEDKVDNKPVSVEA